MAVPWTGAALAHTQGGVRIRRSGRIVFLFAALSAAMAIVVQAASAAPFRAFNDPSPWNVPAAQKGAISSGNPYSDQFTSYSSTMNISGIPPDVGYAKPTFFASPGDPEVPVNVTNPGWAPTGDLQWDGRPVPLPVGAAPAPGGDGHMTIVSADRRTAWEFWACTSADATGIVTQVVAQWDLTGPGYTTRGHNNSARGSGTPLISTTLRAEEALEGFDHALGLTIPHASSDYVRPIAAKSDGERDSGAVRYGTLFVLRGNYPVPSGASAGVRNLIDALKTYGAYVVDQGASMELDADSTHADLWQKTGMRMKSLPLSPSDWRLVNVGSKPSKRAASGQVTLKAASRVLKRGRRVKVKGRVASASSNRGTHAFVQVKRHRRWRTVRRTRIKGDRYAAKVRVRTRGHRKVRMRVKVRGVGHSKAIVLRARR